MASAPSLDASRTLRRRLPAPLRPLADLAFDLAWVGRSDVRALFAAIEPELGAAGASNPALALEVARGARLAELAADRAYVARLEAVMTARRRGRAARSWLARTHPGTGSLQVAYFTAEIGIAECLPLYAGGLGVLAGDLLKAAGELGVEMIGVSLLYGQGFFRQQLDPEGWQHEHRPGMGAGLLPIQKRLRPDGSAVLVGVPLPGRRLDLLVWEARVGGATLLLLDGNLPQNTPADREITRELYSEDRRRRLLQEVALGIGGWRAVEACGLRPAVLHLNEGHCALAAVERARSLMVSLGCDYAAARTVMAASTVFTTHTPLAAAFDAFEPALARRALGLYARDLGLEVEELLDLGRMQPGDASEPFGLTPLAVRHAGALNGVSRLHAQVSQRLFLPLFPRVPAREVPVDAVTNGVDTTSWLGAPMAAVWRRTGWLGGDPFGDGTPLADGLAAVPDEDIAAARTAQRSELVAYVRHRLRREHAGQREAPEHTAGLGGAAGSGTGGPARGARAVTPGIAVVPAADGLAAADVLDPAVLTLAFARRFTGYKRPALLLRDPERLRRLLLDPRRPVQLVMAGKAHPGDTNGKRLVQTVVRFAADPAVRRRAVFLEDDDLDVTAHLVAGADVWLNYPLRPLEACGTSGMKVLANGGLNCSIRDGWWAEAYTPEAGWSFGDEDPPDDARDAEELYRRLEEDIVPAFYAGDGSWMARVRASMALAPQFDTGRALRDYVGRHYLPAAQRQRRLLGGDGRGAGDLAMWAASLRRHWSEIAFRTRMEEGQHVEAVVHLGHVPRDGVRVEAYAEDPPSVVPMELSPAPWPDCWRAVATVPEDRQPARYTLRVIPHHPDAPWPAMLPLIAWEH